MKQFLKDHDLSSFADRNRFLNFLKHRARTMIFYGILFALVFEMAYLTAHGVAQIKQNEDRNTDLLVNLINQSDHNGKALDCILDALGTGDSIKRESIQDCKQRADQQSLTDDTPVRLSMPTSFQSPRPLATPSPQSNPAPRPNSQPQPTPTPQPACIVKVTTICL